MYKSVLPFFKKWRLGMEQIKILVVDDEMRIRKLVSDFLKKSNLF